MHYFAWCDEATAFGPAMQVEDEPIFVQEISQAEGDFPSLTIEIANPRIGLLGPGRKQWCWVSWDNGAAVVPLFHGRIVGVPENLSDEVVRLLFVARPSDYVARKEVVAATLRVLPWWDPVWLQDRVDDPDTVLETYPALWDVDRLTLGVTAADILTGDDGTIDVSADEHFYDGVKVGYAGQPLRRVKVTGTITYDQVGNGEIDLTRELILAFKAAGSPFPSPLIGSYTAAGLLDDWPKPAANIGAGWAAAADSSAATAPFVASASFAVRYTDKSDSTSETGFSKWDTTSDSFGSFIISGAGPETVFYVNWKNYDVTFSLDPITVDFRLSYAASRKRSEVVTLSVAAKIQSILTDPGATEEKTIDLSSAFVDQAVDSAGGSPITYGAPIGDARRNAYFPTDRGQLSLQFLMLLARRELLAKARAAEITFVSTWGKLAETISCRKSVLLHDYRMPGSQALGKVMSWHLSVNGDGEMLAEATIGCGIGYGVVLPDAAAGEDVYATDYATGYTARTGGEVSVIPGELHYESMDGSYVIDDDGVDLFRMTPATAINSLTITGGPNEQKTAIDASLSSTPANVALRTTGDVVVSGGSSSVTNLASVVGLVAGTSYRIAGVDIPPVTNPSLLTLSFIQRIMMSFSGSGGALKLDGSTDFVAVAHTNVPLTISNASGAVLTPDPIAALTATPTVVVLDLVPVTGGDFKTEYTVTVLDLVVAQGINLEAA